MSQRPRRSRLPAGAGWDKLRRSEAAGGAVMVGTVRRLGAVAAVLALAGCMAMPEALRAVLPAGDPARLMPVGSTWAVTAIAGTALPADNGMLLRRESRRRLVGTTACNRFEARLAPRGRRVAVEDLAITGRACLGNPAQQEAALVAALAAIDGVAPGLHGGIVLTGGGTGLVALEAVVPPPPVPKAPR